MQQNKNLKKMIKKQLPDVVIPFVMRIIFIKRRLARRIKRFLFQHESPFKGSVFERFKGMEPVLSDCKDCSVLDFGSSYGLISYEFARKGARLIHGFDIDGPGVRFSKKLFNKLKIKNELTVIEYFKYMWAYEKIYGIEKAEKKVWKKSLIEPEDYELFISFFLYPNIQKQATSN